MSILDRLNRLIRSNINEATGRSEGPNLRSALDEMEKSLREAKRRQAEMRRSERDLVESIREARDEADEWEERAMLALQNDDEDLAREALKVKNEAIRRADELREELRDHRSHMEDIQASLEALETKLQSQKERLSSGGSRSRSGGERRSGGRRAQKWDRKLESRRDDDADETTGSETATPHDDAFRTDETFETFDRMAGKIDAMEAEIEAMRELSGDGGDSKRARLERIFRKMEGQSESRERSSGSQVTSDGGGSGGRDDLSDKKRRIDRLSELKDKFGEGDDDS